MEEVKDDRKEEAAVESPAGEAGALMQCVFDMPASCIKELKAEAGGSFTTYEVVSAHFWQRVNEARRLPAGALIGFTVLANLRSKLNPPLPSSYFGNVVHFGVAKTWAGNLRHDNLAKIAERIHEAILGCNQDSLLLVMHWLELHGNRFLELAHTWIDIIQVNVASSPRFPAYKVDFGWGCPSAVRSPKVPGNGEMVLFGGRPGSADGDMEICLALPSPVMKRLLNDPSFLGKPISSPLRYYE